MAGSGTVGILRALLTADASAYQKTMKQSADASKAFGQSVAKMGEAAQKVTPQLTRLEKSFSGDKLLYSANNLTRAITNIGGAAKLTDREMVKVNRTLADAIDKYRALGQQAPKAMVDLEKATRKAGDSAGVLNTKMVAIGSAIGSFVGTLASRGLSSIINLGSAALESAGQIADMSKRLGISATAVQGFQFAAEQSGTSIEAFGTAINKLNINLATGNKSTIAALDDLHLKLSDLRAMKPEDAFLAVADALAKIPDPMERARLGAELMGKGFAEISPAIQNDLRKTADAASKMSDETVKALDEAGDALDRLKRDATVVAGGVVAAFYAMGAAAIDYANKATQAKTKSQEFEDVAARIRESQGLPPLPGKPALPTLPDIGGGPRPATPEEIARTERQAKALAAAAAAQVKWNEARARERERIEEATQGMVWWLAKMDAIPPAIHSINSSLEEFRDLTFDQFTGTENIATATEHLRAEAERLAVMTLPKLATFWNTEFPEVVRDAYDSMTRGMSVSLTDMLVHLRGFKDGFLDIWRSIRTAFSDILASMLNNFISGFLRNMLAAMAGRSVAGGVGGGLLSGLFGGAAAGGLAATAGSAAAFGAAPAAASAAGAAGIASLGWTVGAPTTAGAGFGATLAALATNPFTIAAAGAGLLGLGIWKKGWFRGGEEGAKVNPARDAFLQQFGGFDALASLLTSLTGEPGGGRLFEKLRTATTMKAFTSASQNILTLLQRRGAAPKTPYEMWHQPRPSLAVAAAVGSPAATMAPAAVSPTRVGTTNVTFNVQAWDTSDMNDAFRTQIIPRLKDALSLNQAGLRTAVADVG